MKLFFGVGIDQYNDEDITPLCGAANDVRYMEMSFHRLGFECVTLTDVDMRRNRSVTTALQEQMRRLGDGDLLVFYFAGHGKTVKDRGQTDQILLLHDVSLRSLNAGYLTNTLSLRQVALETSKPGLRRSLFIDACQRPIDKAQADTRDGSDAVQFEGEVVFRDIGRRAPVAANWDDAASPIAVLNSCSDNEYAREIRTANRGLYSLALQEVINHTVDLGKPLVLDKDFDAQLLRTMGQVAARHNLSQFQQTPVRIGEELRLFGLADRNQNEIRQLSERFEAQFSEGRLDQPWNDSCRDTLAQMASKGLTHDEQTVLRQRLDNALAERKRLAQENEHAVLLANFERQLAAAQLDAPFDDNCADTLRELRRKHLPEDRLTGLRTQLQQAIDKRQLDADREFDENLIALARQTPSKSLYLNYLTHAKLHEHDDEVRKFIADNDRNDEESHLHAQAMARPSIENWQIYLDRFPSGRHAKAAREQLALLKQAAEAKEQKKRDAERRQEADGSDTLPAWKKCRAEAETAELREHADSRIDYLQGLVDEQAAEAAALDRDQRKARTAADHVKPLATWRQFAANAETDWGRQQARNAIEKLEADDRLAWLAACKGNDETSYTAYLLHQPEGGQREEAERRRVTKIVSAANEANKERDRLAWENAKVVRGGVFERRQAIQRYLDAWPQGEYLVSATNLLASLKEQPDSGSRMQWSKPVLVIAVLVALGGGTEMLKNMTKNEPALPSVLEAPPVPATAKSARSAPERAKPESKPAQAVIDAAPAIDAAAWQRQTVQIQNSAWWGAASPEEGKKKMGEKERQWVTQAVAIAQTGQSVLAQLELATLHCRGIAAPVVPQDAKACGEWLSRALANPLLPDGKKGENLADGAAILFDNWVSGRDSPVNRDFAQAVVPGLKAQQKRPYLGFRLALVQGCYLTPPDKTAAKSTLQGISTSGTPADKEKARRMLEDLSQEKPAICRN